VCRAVVVGLLVAATTLAVPGAAAPTVDTAPALDGLFLP